MIISTQDPSSPSRSHPKPRRRITRTRSQWQALLEDFHSSGLSKVVYCKQHGVATSSLNRWQRILEEQSEAADFIDVTDPLSIAPAAPSAREPDNTWQVELALGAGIVLRIRTA